MRTATVTLSHFKQRIEHLLVPSLLREFINKEDVFFSIIIFTPSSHVAFSNQSEEFSDQIWQLDLESTQSVLHDLSSQRLT